MIRVDECPTTLKKAKEGNERLKCGLDQYNNSQYMCLPNKEKTSLVEFCYNGIMGAREKGILHASITF